MITDGQARRIASEHSSSAKYGGALYDLAKYGAIDTEDLALEIQDAESVAGPDERAELRELSLYVFAHGNRRICVGWAYVWDDTPARRS